jgi:hypothetical protein
VAPHPDDLAIELSLASLLPSRRPSKVFLSRKEDTREEDHAPNVKADPERRFYISIADASTTGRRTSDAGVTSRERYLTAAKSGACTLSFDICAGVSAASDAADARARICPSSPSHISAKVVHSARDASAKLATASEAGGLGAQQRSARHISIPSDSVSKGEERNLLMHTPSSSPLRTEAGGLNHPKESAGYVFPKDLAEAESCVLLAPDLFSEAAGELKTCCRNDSASAFLVANSDDEVLTTSVITHSDNPPSILQPSAHDSDTRIPTIARSSKLVYAVLSADSVSAAEERHLLRHTPEYPPSAITPTGNVLRHPAVALETGDEERIAEVDSGGEGRRQAQGVADASDAVATASRNDDAPSGIADPQEWSSLREAHEERAPVLVPVRERIEREAVCETPTGLLLHSTIHPCAGSGEGDGGKLEMRFEIDRTSAQSPANLDSSALTFEVPAISGSIGHASIPQCPAHDSRIHAPLHSGFRTVLSSRIFALVSVIIRTLKITYLGHPVDGGRAPHRPWDREGIGTRRV